LATIAKERTAVTAPPRRSWEGITWSAWIWIAPAVILVLIFFIAPLIYTIYLSFQKTDQLGNVVGSVGFKNYAFVFTDPAMLGILKNNLIWLILATVLCVGLGLILGVLVVRFMI
jgi:alpha-glucoside transport system permease protein